MQEKQTLPSPEDRRGKNREAELFRGGESIWLENASVLEMKELNAHYKEYSQKKKNKKQKNHFKYIEKNSNIY